MTRDDTDFSILLCAYCILSCKPRVAQIECQAVLHERPPLLYDYELYTELRNVSSHIHIGKYIWLI